MDQNNLRLSQLALSQGPLGNEITVDYEEWLISTRRLVLSQATTQGPAEGIVANLEKEFRKLQLQKVTEWKRQQEVQRCKESIGTLKTTTKRPDRCMVVDTGELAYLAFPLPFSRCSKLHFSLGILCPCTILSLRATSLLQPFT